MVDFDETKFKDSDLFAGEHKSVLFAINQVIIIHAVREAEFKKQKEDDNETPKAEVAFSIEGEQDIMVFFTGSEWLRKVLFNEKTTFPFRAIIKVVKKGNFFSFEFTSPSSEVTEKDEENLKLFRLRQDNRYVSRM